MCGMARRLPDDSGQAERIKRSAAQSAALLCLRAREEAADNEEAVSSHVAELVQHSIKVQPEGVYASSMDSKVSHGHTAAAVSMSMCKLFHAV